MGEQMHSNMECICEISYEVRNPLIINSILGSLFKKKRNTETYNKFLCKKIFTVIFANELLWYNRRPWLNAPALNQVTIAFDATVSGNKIVTFWKARGLIASSLVSWLYNCSCVSIFFFSMSSLGYLHHHAKGFGTCVQRICVCRICDCWWSKSLHVSGDSEVQWRGTDQNDEVSS